MMIRGDRLTAKQKDQVLAAFIYRWTIENRKSAEANFHHGGFSFPKIEPCTDAQWLTGHAFYFLKDGSRLNARKPYAESAILAEDF